jgi:hypothetical protein
MSYSESHLENLRATVKVSEVASELGLKLKREGREWIALSPWNKERTPSFTVNDDKQFYHDFSSGRHGDIFALVMEIEGVEFPAAVERVERIGRMPSGKSNGAGNGQHQPKAGRPKGQRPGASKIVATYDYQDHAGNLLYQVVRYDPKSFRQRRPGAVSGTWIWDLAGIDHTLYRLPDLLTDMRQPRDEQCRWFLCEGEKDVLNITNGGVLQATTNSGGAKHFTQALATHFTDAFDVVLMEDNDPAGAARTAMIAPMLLEVGARVRALRIADHEPKGAKDVSDWFERGGTPERLLEITDKLEDWEPPPYQSRYGARTFLSLTGAARSYPWRVKGLIPADDSTMFIGPSRSGKTFAVLDLCMHIALGFDQYAGKNLVPGGIAYLSYEGQAGFENRIRAYAQYHNLDAEQLRHFAWWIEPPGLFADPKAAAALAADIKASVEKWTLPLAAVVIDTHNSATRGSSEIKSEDIGRILDAYDVIRTTVGAPLWIIGHSNRQGEHRGNQQLFNRIEAMLSVERVMDGTGANAAPRRDVNGRIIRRIKVEKQRDGNDEHQWEFVLDEVTLGRDADGDPITSMVSRSPLDTTHGDETKIVPPKGATYLKGNDLRFFKAMLQALGNPDIAVAPPPDFIRRGTGKPVFMGAHERVVSYSEIAKLCRDNTLLDIDNEERRKTRDATVKKWVGRSADQLESLGIINIARSASSQNSGHFVWPTDRPVYGRQLSWPPPRISEASPDDNRESFF